MNKDTFFKATLVLVGLTFVLLSMAMFNGQNGGMAKVAGFYGAPETSFEVLRTFTASLFAVVGLLSWLNVFKSVGFKALCSVMVSIAVIPLLTLIGPSHWISSLGGFPAIGSGQGIIKYFALGAIALTLLNYQKGFSSGLRWLNYFPVALVLLWIGGMKFTLLEAKGIEDLVATSPLMGWMYSVFDLQTASNLIGVYDLLALVLLGLGLKYHVLLWPGIVACGAVFVTTQTFLFTFDGSLQNGILTGTGIFIIKDIWFIVNLLALLAIPAPAQDSEQLTPS